MVHDERDITERQAVALRAMSVEQRLMVSQALRDFAWQSKRSVIARRHPELGADAVEAMVRADFAHATA